MTQFLIDRRQLAELMGAGPGILLVSAVQAVEPFAGLGLTIWHGRRLAGGRFLISSAVTAAATGDEIAIEVTPTGIIAVLGDAPDDLAPWREWFAANLGDNSPVFAGSDPLAALRAITARLIVGQAAIIGDGADLHLALARVRQDYDQIATASNGLVRALASRASGAVTLEVASEIGDGTIRLDARQPMLLQPLGVRVDRISAVALALARTVDDEDDYLRVRLSGIESGRIFGSWLVPLATLPAGWLELELPAPVQWVPETAELELHFTTAAHGHIELATDRLAAFPQNAPRRPGGTDPAMPLAIQIWCGDAGGRFVMPDYWDWVELGNAAHPGGIPLAMPLAAYTRVRVLQGGMPRAYNPVEIEPMVVGLFGGRQTLVQFPLVCIAGMDAIEAAFSLRGGDARNLAVAVWLQPVGQVINSETDLLLSGPNVAWSGWQPFGGAGEARVMMELPVTAASNLQLVVMFDGTTRPASGLSLLEIRKIIFHAMNPGRKARRHSALVAGKDEKAMVIPRALPYQDDAFASGEISPMFREVILDEHFDNGGPYRHLDIRLSKFTVGECYWPFLKFRLVVEQRSPCIEFRDIASWPPSLKKWPVATRDNHGRLTRLFGRPAEVPQLRAEAAPEDLMLIKGLIRCLPGVVAKAALLAKLDPDDCGVWADTAADLAVKLAPHAALVDAAIHN